MRGGLATSIVLAAAFSASASAAPSTQARICEAIASANHLKAASTCLQRSSDVVSFTVPAGAPAGFEATVAYSIVDTSADAQAAWQEDDPGPGPETTLPNVGRIRSLPGASYLYLASGQDDAEATTLVGTVIVDVVLVPTSGGGTTTLKPTVEALLGSAAELVRSAESKAAA